MLAERLKKARERLNLTQSTVASELGVEIGTLSGYERGYRKPSPEAIAKLSKIYQVSTDYLLGITDSQGPISYPAGATPITDTVRVPLLGIVRCGTPIFAEQNIDDYLEIPSFMLNGGQYFALRAKGDSMEDAGIRDGTIMLVKCQSTCDSGQVALVCINGDEATVKRIFFHEDRIELVPENRKYPRSSYPLKEITIQGIVKKVIGDVV